MWKSVEKFFKWIVDHTGISWIAKKTSSGWNWLFSSKVNAAQKNISPKKPSDENVNKSNTVPTVSTRMQNETEEYVSKTDINVEPAENFPEKLNDEPKAVGYIELQENNLLLNLEKGIKVEDYKYSLTKDKIFPQLLVYLRCDKGEYCITGGVDNYYDVSEYVIVKSIIKKNRDGNYIDEDKILVQDNIGHVKKMLGLKDDVTKVKVDNISNQPFEGTALERHDLNPTTVQQMVNNTTIDQLTSSAVTRESSTINIFNRNLELRLADDIQQNLEDYKHPRNNGKYHMKIHCNRSDFNINFSRSDNDDGSVSLIINVLQKGKRELFQVAQMKKSLGFKKGSTFVIIDSIKSFKAPTNSGVPSSETTSLEAKNANCNKSLLVNTHKKKGEHNTDASNKIIQQEVDNEDNEQEKFYDSEKELSGDFNDESLYITGRYDSKTIMENGDIYLLINSVGTLDGKEVYGDNEPEKMKKLLLNSKITDPKVKQHATDTSQSLNAY